MTAQATISPVLLAKPLKHCLSSAEIHEVSRQESRGRLSTHQCPEAGERAQGAQQGLLVLKLTVTQVQTHQLWPEAFRSEHSQLPQGRSLRAPRCVTLPWRVRAAQQVQEGVKHLFGGEPPCTLAPIEGITLKNTTEEGLQASICAIIDYLDKHLPKILSLFRNNKLILKNTTVFLFHFNNAVERSSSETNKTCSSIRCHRPVTVQDHYTMKVKGLQIITSTRQWVETFTETPISHMCIKT
ncbi:hypothetical protein EYF80_035195 [Liparis tanakae]|uniref:Uncharacterized protein n=1 Tax=Liparis tanakae TaxID=230148 RepID=A0A4Z2GMX4_9TELE|nr:hypothetical protein EYF80_035195 [Liparis tanakae]